MTCRRLYCRRGLGVENREGIAHVGECYLYVACGPPYLLGSQRGDSSVVMKPYRTDVDVAVAYMDVKILGELEDNFRRNSYLSDRG